MLSHALIPSLFSPNPLSLPLSLSPVYCSQAIGFCLIPHLTYSVLNLRSIATFRHKICRLWNAIVMPVLCDKKIQTNDGSRFSLIKWYAHLIPSTSLFRSPSPFCFCLSSSVQQKLNFKQMCRHIHNVYIELHLFHWQILFSFGSKSFILSHIGWNK